MSVRTDLEEGVDPKITTFLHTTEVKTSGYSTLVDVIGKYDELPTEGKREVAKTVGNAIKTIIMFKDQKQLLIYLRWKFECPGCKDKKTAEYFTAIEFDLKVPRDEDSKPELKSRAICTVCLKAGIKV